MKDDENAGRYNEGGVIKPGSIVLRDDTGPGERFYTADEYRRIGADVDEGRAAPASPVDPATPVE